MTDELRPSIDQRTVDTTHVNLLSVLHFVGAGLALLGLGFILVHYAMMSTVMNHPVMLARNPGEGPPPGFFDVFKWFYLVFGGWYALSLVGNLMAGIYLRARKHRTFCIAVAAVNCLHLPLGTILGIFTIIVLVRDSVRTAFEVRHTYVVE